MAKHICILEDDDSIREVITMLLSEEAYEVSGFASVSDFIKGGNGKAADLFLLDVMLPDGNGIEVCKLLKRARHTKGVPVLMMSAHANETQIKTSCHPDGFVAKPFDIYDLLGKVDRILAS